MENQLVQVFENEEFGTVRTLLINNEPLFCLPDVCRILDLRIDGGVVRLLEDPISTGVLCKQPIQTTGGIQQMYFVNEYGLYQVIFQSRKPNAIKFQRWVYHKVLPSIRKYGYYVAPNK